jgi:deoxyinosine 3'endonuclease (endonuclease V)
MSMQVTIACLDAAYDCTAVAVAGALIRSWDAEVASQMLVRRFDGPPTSHEPGAFYKRELPLLLSIVPTSTSRLKLSSSTVTFGLTPTDFPD